MNNLQKTNLRLKKNDIKSYITKNCLTALKQYEKGNKIWRGIPGIYKEALLVDPTRIVRKAANTQNLVNLYVSNSPDWDKFPPRNKSLICSFDEDIAKYYTFNISDKCYLVLPIGDPVVGICPKTDFWPSFKFDVSDFSDFFYYQIYPAILKFAKERNISMPDDVPDDNFNDLMKWLQEIDTTFDDKAKLYIAKQVLVNKHKAKDILIPSIVSFIKNVYSPKNFKLQRVSTMVSDNKAEVWLSARSILITEDKLMEIF